MHRITGKPRRWYPLPPAWLLPRELPWENLEKARERRIFEGHQPFSRLVIRMPRDPAITQSHLMPGPSLELERAKHRHALRGGILGLFRTHKVDPLLPFNINSTLKEETKARHQRWMRLQRVPLSWSQTPATTTSQGGEPSSVNHVELRYAHPITHEL
eukprot:RCo013600